MPSVCFSIDFGDPCGTLEEMGCDEFTNAQEVIDALKADGHNVADACDRWSLLQYGTVTVTFTPDIPEELQMQTVWREDEDVPEALDGVKLAKLARWVQENETTAEWSDFARREVEEETA